MRYMRTSENTYSTTFMNKPSRSASELGCLLRILLPLRETRLAVPRWARASGTPLAHTHHLQVSFCVLGS
jgi:hypothetical protein